MKNYYLAICYLCNQSCTGCPIDFNEKKEKILSFEKIESLVEKNVLQGEKDDLRVVTISGGEPTLHPKFFQIIDFLVKRGIYINLLTNGEKFYDTGFCEDFLRVIDIRRVRVITTIHSSSPMIHESQNNSIGSHERSIEGLKKLFNCGVSITIKHCVTKKNLKDTSEFMEFINRSFHPMVDIELWGLDYCGMTFENAQELYVPFHKMSYSLEKGLDEYLQFSSNNGRGLSIFNIPLCTVDPFYWFLFKLKGSDVIFDTYFDTSNEVNEMKDDTSTGANQCMHCYVRDVCPGTYNSTFKLFGDDAVQKIAEYK